MDRPCEREIQELMRKRVKQDAPDYRACRNPVKGHPDNLSGRLSAKCTVRVSKHRCTQTSFRGVRRPRDHFLLVDLMIFYIFFLFGEMTLRS